jgi:hypothetical protein
MKMIRVGHLRTTAILSGIPATIEEYGDWLPESQIAAFKSGYTYADSLSGAPEQQVSSLIWVATIEALDGSIYEAPNQEVAMEWHQQLLGTAPGPIPPLPGDGSRSFEKDELRVEKWPSSEQ